MKNYLSWLLVGCLLIAVNANAVSIGAQSGAARDWVKVGEDAEWEELGTFSAGFSLDTVLDEEGYKGMTFGLRLTDDTNISQYLVEYWTVTSALEWFVGGNIDVWEKEITGSNEFLGGGRAGIWRDPPRSLGPLLCRIRWTPALGDVSRPAAYRRTVTPHEGPRDANPGVESAPASEDWA